MGRKAFLFLCVFCSSALIHPTTAPAQAKCICFTWAFLAAVIGGPDRILDVTGQPVVHAGDRLRILIVPETGGNFYVFRIDPRGELTILNSSENVMGRNRIMLPEQGQWYTIQDSAGADSFYLLGTNYSMDALSKAVQAYSEEPQSADLRSAVLAEFEKAQRSYSEKHVVERGVPIEGTLGEATSVNAGRFYAKTIRLNHE